MIAPPQGLSQLAASDLPAIHRFFALPDVFRYLFDGAPPLPSFYDEWNPLAYVNRQGRGAWVRRRGDEISAFLQAGDGDEPDGCELVWIVHPDDWGKGLATAMARFAIAHAFEDRNTPFVWAGTDGPNLASVRVMQKAGLKFWKEMDYPLGKGVAYRLDRAEFRQSDRPA